MKRVIAGSVNLRALLQNGSLRPELSLDEAVDTVWTVTSAEVYRLLTVDRGWSGDRYELWLAETLGLLLLPPRSMTA